MFEDRMGFKQYLMSEDPAIHEGVKNWLERVLGFYGEEGGVDVEVIRDQLLLVNETVDYIYSDFTETDIKYEKGSRKLLEQVAEEVVSPEMEDLDKALALMRRCRDNRDNTKSGINFYGGSEEELLKRGAIMCNEIHRVYVCLCQISGLPARLMCSHISGHMMSEVFIDGKWMWMDCMQGMYCFKENGQVASTWDLKQDPGIFDKQTEEVLKDCRPTKLTGLEEFTDFEKAYRTAKAKECYFNPSEAIAIGNYYVWEKDKYTFPWRVECADPVQREKALFAENRFRKKHGWPDYYFDFHLFDHEV